ncbi:MAG TPA: alpha/beta fold hydrolase, partial [Blastocatellia bacterium]|nr:alpha/beta fold hydrolase [Blastocatellia bacterium]
MKRRTGLAPVVIVLSSFVLISALRQGALGQGQTDHPARGTSRIKLEPCPGPAEKDALCGKYEVFENRSTRSGRKITLNVLMLPATAPTPEPDPVFYFEGGPGGAAVATAKGGGRKVLFDLLRKRRDVVFVDQRGTGESNQLACAMNDPADLQTSFGERFPIERVRQCRTELEKIADLTLYSTPIAMDDLDEVRDALGYQRINLYGGSYGSTAAMSYLRQHGDHVRSAVVAGVAPVDYRLPLPIAKGVQHALDRMLEDCGASDGCRSAYPKLKAELAELIARLEKQPATVTITDPTTRKSQSVTITRNAFVEHLRLLLYFPQMISQVPLFIHQAYQNDYALFSTYALIFSRVIENTIARGMHLSVVCGEGLPFINEADITREAAGTIYSDTLVRSYKKACENWPRARIPANFVEPV